MGKLNNKAVRRKEKKQLRKAEQEKNVVIEDTELMSKDQLKKISKQPTNNIRVSGKRKSRMLKRLRRSHKSKSQMEVEVTSGSGSGSVRSKVKGTAVMDTEAVSDNDETAEDVEMT